MQKNKQLYFILTFFDTQRYELFLDWDPSEWVNRIEDHSHEPSSRTSSFQNHPEISSIFQAHQTSQ